jgi:hypothetical protein
MPFRTASGSSRYPVAIKPLRSIQRSTRPDSGEILAIRSVCHTLAYTSPRMYSSSFRSRTGTPPSVTVTRLTSRNVSGRGDHHDLIRLTSSGIYRAASSRPTTDCGTSQTAAVRIQKRLTQATSDLVSRATFRAVQKLSVWLYFTISALDNDSGVSAESVPSDPRSVFSPSL